MKLNGYTYYRIHIGCGKKQIDTNVSDHYLNDFTEMSQNDLGARKAFSKYHTDSSNTRPYLLVPYDTVSRLTTHDSRLRLLRIPDACSRR